MTIASARMTEDAFIRLPDDGRKYELVDGEAIALPGGFEHDIIGVNVALLIKPFAKGRGYVSGAQAGFRMVGGNIRSPDVAFMLKTRLQDGLPSKGFENGAPDLCIEIVSRSEEPSDIERKRREYFASGAQQVWYLYPDTVHMRVYTTPDLFVEYKANAEISGGDLLPGFRCRVADLFTLE